ncbi:hypothetical protein ACFE04_011013 [Oxalis oulophora]
MAMRNIIVRTISIASSETSSSPLLSNLTTRSFCCSTTKHRQEMHNNSKEEKPTIEDQNNVAQLQQNQDKEVEEGESGGDFVNKETGEIGGPRGKEPTRFGDWERNGRCSDF